MGVPQADDFEEISKRIAELRKERKERGEREHVWNAADNTCAVCKALKTSFRGVFACMGSPEP